MEIVLQILIIVFLLILVSWCIDFKGILRKMADKGLCCHLWYVEDELTTKTFQSGDNEETSYPIKIEQVLICKNCGEIRKVVAK